MSTDTSILGLQSTFEDTPASQPSLLARWSSNFMKAQIARGERRAAAHIKALSPQMLTGFGLTPDEVAEVRRTGKFPASLWKAER